MPTLNWIGKDTVVKHHNEVLFRLLELVPERSCGPIGLGAFKKTPYALEV